MSVEMSVEVPMQLTRRIYKIVKNFTGGLFVKGSVQDGLWGGRKTVAPITGAGKCMVQILACLIQAIIL
jgi:hypothetical protein